MQATDVDRNEKIAVLEASLLVAKMAYAEANGNIESINSRLGTAIALIPAVAAFTVLDVPVTLATPKEEVSWLGFLMYIAGAFCIVCGTATLFVGLKAKPTKTPFNLDSLKSQSAPEYKDLVSFYRQQLANFTHYTQRYADLAAEKGRRFNLGAGFALLGVLLIVLMRVILRLLGGTDVS